MRPEPNQSRTCRVCGAALQPENRYCPNCGTPTTEATSVVEPTSADPVGVGDSGEPVDSDSHVIRGIQNNLMPASRRPGSFT
ncbi:MAG: zinc-ribbon domain-containing protein [Chloroflexia bacterium]|nr:zinc-ribbon domain-containing protein [Chloroflexia bacterium]